MNGDENSAVESKVQAEVEQSVILQVSKEVSSPVEQSDTTDTTQILSAGVVDGSESKSDGKDSNFTEPLNSHLLCWRYFVSFIRFSLFGISYTYALSRVRSFHHLLLSRPHLDLDHCWKVFRR